MSAVATQPRAANAASADRTTQRTGGPSPQAGDQTAPTQQREAMRAICTHVYHAEAIVSMVAESCGSDLAWGVIYALRSLLDRVNAMERRQDYGSGSHSVFSDVFCELSCFVTLLEHVNLTEQIELFDAAATILQAAENAADEMQDAMFEAAKECSHA